MTFPRYDEYKDSGVEWLGDVPAHWGVAPLKRQSRLLTEKTDARTNPVALENVEGWSGRFVPTESDFQGDGVAFERGDILFGKLRPYLAKVLLADYDGQAVGDFHVIRPAPKVLPRYLAYFIRNRDFISIVDGSTYGAKMPRASWDFMGMMPLVAPSLPEQTAIAAFLDRETAKIEDLVAEQQNLIALLKEKRQALISHAVTKGLNPNASMKDSGVEWLGEVPSHWDVVRFQRVVFVAEGQVDPEQAPYRSMVLIAPNYVESGTGRILSLETAEEQSAESGKYLCQAGDVIYSKIRPALRKACIAPAECLCSADMYPLRGNERLENRYLHWFLLTEQFSTLSVLESERVAMPKINRESLKAVRLTLPPSNEQREIAAHLGHETVKIDDLMAEAESTITLLQERRTALISAAVTGKIDVRNAIARMEEATA